MMVFQALLLAAVAVAAATPPPLPPKLDVQRIRFGSNLLVSEDGRWMAAGDASFITIWKVGETRPTASLEWKTDPKTSALIPLAFTADRKKLILAKSNWGSGTGMDTGPGASLELAIGDLGTEKIAVRFPRHPNRWGEIVRGIKRAEGYHGVSLSPDGAKIAVRTQYYVDQTLHNENSVLTMSGKTLRKTVTSHTKDAALNRWVDSKGGTQGACAYASDGVLLSARADAGSCSIIDCETGKRLSFLDSCSIESDGLPTLTAIGDKVYASGEIRDWDARTGSILRTYTEKFIFADPYRLKKRARSADGRYIALLAQDERDGRVAAESLVLIDADTGKTLGTKEYSVGDGGLNYIENVAPDGSSIVLSDGSFASVLPFAAREAAPGLVEAPMAPRVNVDAVPSALAKTDPDAFAVVIGVEKYRQAGIPAVDYAARDAKTMHSYLTGAMGFDSKNIVLLTDERASKTDLEKHLGTWLKNRVGPKSRVFVYYAGHGAPNPTTGAGYLMPYEADPSYLEDTAYPLAKMYASLDALPTKDVTVVLDACFSGQGPRSLIAKGARPLISVAAQKGPERATVIAAAASNQISLSDPDAKHGLLTYYLLEGLHGGADADGDGRITATEVFAYAKPAVERAARLQNQEQTPTASASLEAAARPWLTLKK